MIRKFSSSDIRAYAGLLMVALIGLWPVSTGLFPLKNDDIIYFLPYRFNIVEIIRSGHWPTWSPSIYMGFPIGSDMQSGAWNPLVWLLSILGRYDMTSLRIELLIYFFLAGLGFYKLAREFGNSSPISFAVAISFMFCGFMMDSGQILCWVACASILPFSCLYFYRIIKRPQIKSSVKFALTNCFLLVAGYPSFFIINFYLFFLLSFGLALYLLKQKNIKRLRQVFSMLAVAGALMLVTTALAWFSYVEMLPFYNRGHALSLRGALENSFQTSYLLSAFWPFAITWANPPFTNEAAIFRNIYFGLLLLPFAVYGFFQTRSWPYIAIAALTAICFCFSLGNQLPLRRMAFQYLPLMNTFRHPANFRVFVIIGILLFAARGLQMFEANEPGSFRFMRKGFWILLFACAITALYFLIASWHTSPIDKALVYNRLVTSGLFNEAMFAGAIIQSCFLAAAIFAIYRQKFRWFLVLAMINSILIAQPQIFYGIVSKQSTAAISTLIRNAPKEFGTSGLELPIGFQQPNEMLRYGNFSGLGAFYAKRPVLSGSFTSPTILSKYYIFFKDSLLVKKLSEHPFIFVGDTIQTEKGIVVEPAAGGEPVSLLTFSPDKLSFRAESSRLKVISVCQNNYPGWQASMDGKPVEITTVNHCFMGLALPPGKHEFVLSFKPRWFYGALLFCLFGLTISTWLLFKRPTLSH